MIGMIVAHLKLFTRQNCQTQHVGPVPVPHTVKVIIPFMVKHLITP
jgi:hypothetical protein